MIILLACGIHCVIHRKSTDIFIDNAKFGSLTRICMVEKYFKIIVRIQGELIVTGEFCDLMTKVICLKKLFIHGLVSEGSVQMSFKSKLCIYVIIITLNCHCHCLLKIFGKATRDFYIHVLSALCLSCEINKTIVIQSNHSNCILSLWLVK